MERVEFDFNISDRYEYYVKKTDENDYIKYNINEISLDKGT